MGYMAGRNRIENYLWMDRGQRTLMSINVHICTAEALTRDGACVLVVTCLAVVTLKQALLPRN